MTILDEFQVRMYQVLGKANVQFQWAENRMMAEGEQDRKILDSYAEKKNREEERKIIDTLLTTVSQRIWDEMGPLPYNPPGPEFIRQVLQTKALEEFTGQTLWTPGSWTVLDDD